MFEHYVIGYHQIAATYRSMKVNNCALFWKWMRSGCFVAEVIRRDWFQEQL
jgi:hypothetical protein